MQEQNNYNHFMHSRPIEYVDSTVKSQITFDDIVKCTSKNSNIIVRFFNRLIRLNKGWINDSKVERLLGNLANTPEKRDKLNEISKIMVGLSDSFRRVSVDIAINTKWKDKYTETMSILKKFEIEASELKQLVIKINEVIKNAEKRDIEEQIDNKEQAGGIEKINSETIRDQRRNLLESFHMLQGRENFQYPEKIRNYRKEITRARKFIKKENNLKNVNQKTADLLKSVNALQMISDKNTLREHFVDYLIETKTDIAELEKLEKVYEDFVDDLAEKEAIKDFEIFDKKTLPKNNNLGQETLDSFNIYLANRTRQANRRSK